jgi:hypothetical protein
MMQGGAQRSPAFTMQTNTMAQPQGGYLPMSGAPAVSQLPAVVQEAQPAPITVPASAPSRSRSTPGTPRSSGSSTPRSKAAQQQQQQPVRMQSVDGMLSGLPTAPATYSQQQTMPSAATIMPVLASAPPGVPQTYAGRPLQVAPAAYVPAPSATAPPYMAYSGGSQSQSQYAGSPLYPAHPMPPAGSYAMAAVAPPGGTMMAAAPSVGGAVGGMQQAPQMQGVQGTIAPSVKMAVGQAQYYSAAGSLQGMRPTPGVPDGMALPTAGQGGQVAFVGQPAAPPQGAAGAMYQFPGGPSHFVAQQPAAAPFVPPLQPYSSTPAYMPGLAPPGAPPNNAPPPPAAGPAAKGKGGKAASAPRANAVPITIPPSLLPPVRFSSD